MAHIHTMEQPLIRVLKASSSPKIQDVSYNFFSINLVPGGLFHHYSVQFFFTFQNTSHWRTPYTHHINFVSSSGSRYGFISSLATAGCPPLVKSALSSSRSSKILHYFTTSALHLKNMGNVLSRSNKKGSKKGRQFMIKDGALNLSTTGIPPAFRGLNTHDTSVTEASIFQAPSMSSLCSLSAEPGRTELPFGRKKPYV